MKLEVVGKWAFLIGLILAVVASFVTGYTSTIMLILFILGLLVGFLNITAKDSQKFLVALITLVVLNIAFINVLEILGTVSTYLDSILANFISFASAAGLVVAIKSVIETSKR